MNHKTFNLFLIVLLSSLAIIVDANKPKTCTTTKTKSQTVTFTKSCGTFLPQKTHGDWCPKKAKQENCKDYQTTETVTCTPTTTTTIICSPSLISKEACCNEGGVGQNNLGPLFIAPIVVTILRDNVTTAVGCCKYCFDNPLCDFWRIAFSISFHECVLYTWNQICTNFTLNQIPTWNVGMIGCDKCRARAVPE